MQGPLGAYPQDLHKIFSEGPLQGLDQDLHTKIWTDLLESFTCFLHKKPLVEPTTRALVQAPTMRGGCRQQAPTTSWKQKRQEEEEGEEEEEEAGGGEEEERNKQDEIKNTNHKIQKQSKTKIKGETVSENNDRHWQPEQAGAAWSFKSKGIWR